MEFPIYASTPDQMTLYAIDGPRRLRELKRIGNPDSSNRFIPHVLEADDFANGLYIKDIIQGVEEGRFVLIPAESFEVFWTY
jgi:hypothetical protein